MTLTARHVPFKEAQRFIREHHRHNVSDRGWIVGCGAFSDGVLIGVGVLGRPKAPALQNGYTAEITRCTTDGTRNACSFLYGRLCKVAFALGFTKVVTYTLITEPGTSLFAAGFAPEHVTKDQKWDRKSRPRDDVTPSGKKIRWSRVA